jgi:cell division protein FtsB
MLNAMRSHMKSMKSLKSKMQSLIVLAAVVVVPQFAQAQATSRVIPFNNLASNYPRRTTQSVIVQLWDAATAGNLVFSESQPSVYVDHDGNVSFVFGSQTTNGLDPNNFPSGESRYLDVIDATTQVSALANGRIALNATAFALSPGPPGPKGDKGDAGLPGVVQSVSAGDASIVIIGSTANPAVAVAANGITNANVANGALSPGKISGIAATLGVNTFSGSQTVNGDIGITGNLRIGDSTAMGGNVLKGGALFIHNFGTNNTFIGKGAGNLTMTGDGNNTAAGSLALTSNTTGSFNIALGANALQFNTTGLSNIAVGVQALASNTAGNFNTAIGNGALTVNAGSFNTATGSFALQSNTTGFSNTASGSASLPNNTIGTNNTATGFFALFTNTTGSFNTAIGNGADVASDNLTNATAIGNGAVVDASNKIRLGNNSVTVIEGQVPYTFTSDATKKENFQRVDGEDVLRKISGLNVTSWNYIGHDPRQFRHYGLVAQEFFAAFGHDAMGTIGTDTTINSGDLDGILTIGVQALEKRTRGVQALRAENADLSKNIGAMKAENADLSKKIDAMKAENADLNKEISSLKARLEALERLLANLKGAVDQ